MTPHSGLFLISVDWSKTPVSCWNRFTSSVFITAVKARRGGSLTIAVSTCFDIDAWPEPMCPVFSQMCQGSFLLGLFIDWTICRPPGSHHTSPLLSPTSQFARWRANWLVGDWWVLRSLSLPSDFMVKVVEVSDSSQQKTLRGHEAPVLSVAFDPKDEYLVGNPLLQRCRLLFFPLVHNRPRRFDISPLETPR